MPRKKRQYAQDPEPKPDLTPMIDIVFNLIIFFLIVSELSNLAVEDLQLSYADQAEPPPKGPGRTLVVNVKEPGVAKIGGRSYALGPEAVALHPDLRRYLELEALATDDPGAEASSLEVTIRADRDVPAEGIQRVMDACSRSKIVMTRFAATPGNPDSGN